MKVQKLNRRQAYQTLYLSRFDFTLKHILGTKMKKTDRRLDQKVEVEKYNENQTLIKIQQICSLAEVIIEGLEVNIIEKIEITKGKDKKVVRVVEEIKKVEVKVLRKDKQQIEKKLVIKEEKIYMLKNEELRTEIIQLYYNILIVGYKEKQKMTELVTRNYQWPEVTRDMGKYVDSCDMCQRMKNHIKILAGKLKLSEVLEKLWTYLIVTLL